MRNFAAEITGIKLISFRSDVMIDLIAQMQQFTVYESIFDPLVRAELIVDDQIGLFTNFPLTGEEFISFTYRPTSNLEQPPELKRVFVINAITNITPSVNARGYRYSINLISRFAFENARVKVSHAYTGAISDAANELFVNYLVGPAKRLKSSNPYPSHEIVSSVPQSIIDIEPSLEATSTIVIPNLRPIEALRWLANKAVARDFKTAYVYTFYETLSGFHFKTVQRDMHDERLRLKVKSSPYYFIADIALANSHQFVLDGHSYTINPMRSIANLDQKKRVSTIDKVIGGYFENSYFEINLYENSYKSTYLKQEHQTLTKLDPYMSDTSDYASASRYEERHDNEEANRVYYAFNNVNGPDRDATPFDYSKKYGLMNMSQVGFDQVSLNATLEGDTRREAGDMIYLLLPEMHGFNIVRSDPFLTGYYLITSIKHVFSVGGHHGMVLGLSKDSYAANLDSYQSRYVTERGSGGHYRS